MNHFLTINELTKQQIENLLEAALAFKSQSNYPIYAQRTVANLFYEPSTRTRISFEMAARRLSMSVVNLDLKLSSEVKGEAIKDTCKNLAAMGIDTLVIRHSQNGIQEELAKDLGQKVHIVNAGDGTHAHPSQAILDMMTILEKKPRLDQLKMVLLGNIKHSRVAHSFQALCAKLGVGELVLVAPKLWQPETVDYGRVTSDLAEGLSEADVVLCLRVQLERLLESEYLNLDEYRCDFALSLKSLSQAKPDVMVMHPGPVNRGIEIDSEVVDGKHSFILEQVKNGVYARMAILDALRS